MGQQAFLIIFSADDFYYSTSTQIPVFLREMNKKDSTTKLKALQEFTDDAIKRILPI